MELHFCQYWRIYYLDNDRQKRILESNLFYGQLQNRICYYHNLGYTFLDYEAAI